MESNSRPKKVRFVDGPSSVATAKPRFLHTGRKQRRLSSHDAKPGGAGQQIVIEMVQHPTEVIVILQNPLQCVSKLIEKKWC